MLQNHLEISLETCVSGEKCGPAKLFGKKTVKLFNKRDFESLQSASTCQVHYILFARRTFFFSFFVWPRNLHLFWTGIFLKTFFGGVYCRRRFCARQNCVHIQSHNENGESCYKWVQCYSCCHIWKVHFKDQTSKFHLIAVKQLFVLPGRQVETKKQQSHHFLREISLPVTISHKLVELV